MLGLKIAAVVVALLALAGAGKWAGDTIHKAHERDAALERTAQVEAEKVALARTFAEAQGADLGIAKDLARIRADMARQAAAFAQSLTAANLMLEVSHAPNPDGSCPPTHERDPVIYRGLFNSAAAGPPAP